MKVKAIVTGSEAKQDYLFLSDEGVVFVLLSRLVDCTGNEAFFL